MTTRREFLTNSAALGLFTGTGMAAALSNFSAHAANVSGYKALVCVFLFGGMDSYDTVLPFDQTSYDRLAEIRSSLFEEYAGLPGGSSRARDQLMQINPVNAADFGARQFALPPELAPLHALFESGQAAIMANVGPLIRPIDNVDFENEIADIPDRLFSHNDQQSTWQSFAPEGSLFGWGGLFADAVINANANNNAAFTAITTSGNSVFLAGDVARAYQVDGNMGAQLATVGDESEIPDNIQTLIRDSFSGMSLPDRNLFENDIAAIQGGALVTNDQFSAALENTTTPLTTNFPNSNLGRQLESVANVINARVALEAQRQVFFVALGGFDTHSTQAQDLPNRHNQVAQAIAAFYQATQEMGVGSDVTTFTASDFGRTLSINGDGTDHGWGAHHFIVGDAVNGGRIYGEMPPYDFDHSLDAGNGRLIPSTSVQQYAATLGSWFGLDQNELEASLPNLTNFSNQNLGFV